jgi:hypothetical protein
MEGPVEIFGVRWLAAVFLWSAVIYHRFSQHMRRHKCRGRRQGEKQSGNDHEYMVPALHSKDG